MAQDPQSKGPDRISGVVINSVTHEPIARALVVSNDERFAAMTDINGGFEFVFSETAAGNDAPAGPGRPVSPGDGIVNPRSYTLTARRPGFLTGPDSQVQNLQQVPDGKPVVISLVPEALIVGHVALPTAEPPDPIEVELFQRQVRNGRSHWVSVGVQSTRSSGEFRFADLSAGTYKLLTHELMDEDPKATAPGGQVYGYAPVYYPNANGFAAAGTIELTAGKAVHANLSLVRQPYYSIIVPVANVPPGVSLNVKVLVQGREGPGYSLGYDMRRQAITGLLPRGNYRLEAAAFGPKVFSGAANVTVDGPVEGLVLPMVAGSSITVNVKSEFTAEDNPVPTKPRGVIGSINPRKQAFDATVVFEPADDFGTQQGASSSRLTQGDSLQMENVAPGRYWVQVYPTRGYAASVTAGGVNLRRYPLVVPAGSSVPSIEVILRDDSATIEGTVEGASGLSEPAAPMAQGPNAFVGPPPAAISARVYCIPSPDSTGRFAEAFVNQDGKFYAVSLPPGEYRVLALSHLQPDLEYENPAAMQAYDGKGQVIRLAAGQKEKVQLQLISTSE